MAADKIIDLGKSVYALAEEYPEIIPIMSELGFSDIAKPGMLQTAGRIMTIPLGARAKGIDLEHIKEKLIENGFELADGQ